MTVTTNPAPTRGDAWAKATGASLYTADLPHEGALHAVVVRSTVPHAHLGSVDVRAALEVPGVVAALTAEDLPSGLGGRRVRDTPLLATGKVRFSGERVAVVVATSRSAAEDGAAAVEIDYDTLPCVYDARSALAAGAPAVHDAPWSYPGAAVGPTDHPNLQSAIEQGDPASADDVAAAAFSVDRTYRTPSGHQGYLETQAWMAAPGEGGTVRLWATTKSPFRLRQQIADCIGLDVERIQVEPALLGGDFGGKGTLGEAPLCTALALRLGRPVRMVLRSGEDLTATDARHPSEVRVRVGCDAAGRLAGLCVDAVFAGGAYASSKPILSVNLHGAQEAALGYRVPSFWVQSRIAYTNTMPKGHMRSPGAPQVVFAVERALDELANIASLDPVELRRRNLLRDGDTDAYGHRWPEARGVATLDAAVGAPLHASPPPGWVSGRGVAAYARPTPAPGQTSLRLHREPSGRLVVDVPIPETGTGSHSVVRDELAEALGVDPGTITVRQVSTRATGYDPGVGASRVTVGMTKAVDELARAWREAREDGPVTIDSRAGDDHPALSYCVQLAYVAVDPATGEFKVLELVSAVDVADIVRPTSHQLQIDGGAVMGVGFACLEDLLEDEGQVWASNLAEFKLPTAVDVPQLTTVLVPGGEGVGPSNVKAVGELTNVPTAAAIANAIARATGAQMRELPMTAERVHQTLTEGAP